MHSPVAAETHAEATSTSLSEAAMGSMAVISVGADEYLLALRERVLRTAGFFVCSLTPEKANYISYSHAPHIWIFCSTIQIDVLRDLVCNIRMHSPKSKLMLLEGSASEDQDTSLFDTALNPISIEGMLSVIGKFAASRP
jgi:hypothetical protein